MNMIIDRLTYRYSPNTAFETTAIEDISLSISEGEFIGIIGHTGSGKSTLIQHLNGLLKGTLGTIYVDGKDAYEKDFSFVKLREKVGMVFQYPEYQLFETTVFEDVKFGPKNQGLDDKQASIRAYEALEKLKFPRELVTQSPFDLSGGQKRLAAIAGVLAMHPEILILDEPTAGLDPKARKDLLDILSLLQKNTGKTVILVSHNMDDVANYVERLVVMNKGHVMMDGPVREVFSHFKELENMGLSAPEVMYLLRDLKAAGFELEGSPINKYEAAEAILKALEVKGD